MPRFPGFARRALGGALAELQIARREGPEALARRDGAPAQQHLLAPHGNGADDRARVDVVDRAARVAARAEARAEARAAARAEASGVTDADVARGATAVEMAAVRAACSPEMAVASCVVVALHGYALAAGLEMALLCDIRLAATDTVVGLPDAADTGREQSRLIAFSLALYSGQMCTTPQNILVPRAGITTESGGKTVDQLAADLAGAVDQEVVAEW